LTSETEKAQVKHTAIHVCHHPLPNWRS